MPARMSSSESRSPDGPAPTTITYGVYEYIRQTLVYLSISHLVKCWFHLAYGHCSNTIIWSTLPSLERSRGMCMPQLAGLNSFHINTS